MTITTKFNIGQEVWYIKDYSTEQACAKIIKATIYVEKSGAVYNYTRYHFEVQEGNYLAGEFTKAEHAIYPTKQTLLDSLR